MGVVICSVKLLRAPALRFGVIFTRCLALNIFLTFLNVVCSWGLWLKFPKHIVSLRFVHGSGRRRTHLDDQYRAVGIL